MNEPVYFFWLDGEDLPARTLTEFRRDSSVMQLDAERMEVCKIEESEWVALSSLIDFTKEWRTKPDVSEPLYQFRLGDKTLPSRTLTEFRECHWIPSEEARQMMVRQDGTVRWFPLSGLIDFNEEWRLSQEKENYVYHFRLDGEVLRSAILDEFAADQWLLQTDAMRMEACREDSSEWTPLTQLIDFSKPWRTIPSEDGIAGEMSRPTPIWDEYYFWRMAGEPVRGIRTKLRNLILSPPFARNEAWRVEVQAASGEFVPLTSILDFSKGWPASAPSLSGWATAKLLEASSPSVWDSTYQFNLGGKTQPPKTLREFMLSPDISRAIVDSAELRREGAQEWIPLTSLLDFSDQWPVPPGKKASPVNGVKAQPPAEDPGCAPVAFGVLLLVGVVMIIAAMSMETGVKTGRGGDEVYNLSKGQNQTTLLILGVALAGVMVLALVMYKPPEKK